jgi:hypothetical protein
MQWNNGVPPTILFAREANVSNDANQSATWHQNSEGFSPYFLDLRNKVFVVGDVAELALGIVVPLERPIRR